MYSRMVWEKIKENHKMIKRNLHNDATEFLKFRVKQHQLRLHLDYN